MKVIEIGTGYTSIPAQMGAATEIVVEKLTKAMLKSGIDVKILDIKDKHRIESPLPIEEVYVPSIFSSNEVVKLGFTHKMKRVIYSVSLAYKLRKIIKQSQEHLFIHFHNQYNLFFFLKLTSKSLREKITIGYTVHSYVWFGKYEDIKNTIKKRYFQEVYCCQQADRVFVLNDVVTKMLVDNYSIEKDKIRKIFNGVDTDVYDEKRVTEQQIKLLKEKYNLQGKTIIFQVGSICPRKNQLNSLELLAPIMHNNKDLAFAYAGGIIDENYAMQIKNKAEQLNLSDRVVYCGEISPGDELNAHYAMSKATIVNSKAEAYGLVITESLSCSRPVFVNTQLIDSINYWKDNEGEGIIRITNNFVEDINRLLEDKPYYFDMQNKARKLAFDKLSWDASTRLHMTYM